MKISFALALSLITTLTIAQDYRWQQRAEYTMNVSLDDKTHILTGSQKLVYYNNSNDTLNKVYYHLYFNAFQPGSMMDVRSSTIADPDKRIGTRISKLKPDEIGYQKVSNLKQDGKPTIIRVNGTILEVELAKPILPKGKTVLELQFEAQVPIQIRRSGRNNSEGIAYSMTQWYPKLAEYDFQGWHAYQYVAREFHGVWGDFDVTISMDSSFVVAGSGVLQDADKVGHGYGKSGSVPHRKDKNIKWRFVAKNVIDFAWAADPDYAHDRVEVPGGPVVHFFYQPNDKTRNTWKAIQPIVVETFRYFNEHFGKYPFDTYSVIQGGDGGMEYPMCTLVVGEGKLEGLASTVVHEIAHSWYQMALASNESLHAWMDEGFADFACDEFLAHYTNTANDHAASYKSYFSVVNAGAYEIPDMHSDHFNTNKGYRTGSYVAGALFAHQMKYVIGEKNFYTGFKRYYNTWKFRHPEPNDFIRVMEKTSGLQLHWFLRYWTQTTKKIDYEIDDVLESGDSTKVILRRSGDIPMPIDLLVRYKDGSTEWRYIPLNEMMGAKPAEDAITRVVETDWHWTNPTYTIVLPKKISGIQSLEIDPSKRMADVSPANNIWRGTDITITNPEEGKN